MLLPIPDAAWLMIESPETPQHATAVLIFEYPAEAEHDWVRNLYERFRQATDLAWPFDQKLKHPFGRFKLYSWVLDRDVDLDHHFHYSSLPPYTGEAELMSHVSDVHAVALDRARPLWEIHLIDGIQPAADSSRRRFALLAKFHHALFDGVGSMRILRRMFSNDPTQREMSPPWQTSAKAKPDAGDLPTDSVPIDSVPIDSISTVRAPADHRREGSGSELIDRERWSPSTSCSAAVTTVGTLFSQFRSRRKGITNEALPFMAPHSILNTRVTAPREVVTGSWSLKRVLAVSKTLGVSLNDVVVAMSAHAIRSYLIDSDAVPSKPMTAMIPVSIRTEADDASGNALSFIVADLGTDLADSRERIQGISNSISAAKERLMSMGRMEQIAYGLAIASPYLVTPLVGLGGYGPPPMNIVISNVPGPKSTHYLDGATLQAIYPASVLEQGQALNITMASYDGQMQFALTACRKSLPKVEALLEFMEDGLLALEAPKSAS